MKLFILCLNILILTVSSGCAVAPTNTPRFAPAPSAPDGYATFYVYRLGAPPYTRDIKLSIAGKPVIDAPEQAYTWMFVRAGTHTLFAEWPRDFLGPKKWPDATATQAFEPGESYYFRVAGNVGVASGGLFSSGGMVLTSYLTRRPTDARKSELVACCRYMQPASERLE
jgi:hypothetical protein